MPTDIAATRVPRRPAERSGRAAQTASLFAAVAAHLFEAALSRALRHKALVLAGLVVAAGTTTIAWNATMSQSRLHPAPLFGTPKAASVPARAPDPVAIPPLPAARPKSLTATDAAVPVPPSRSAAGPSIAELLHAPETGSIAPPELSRIVASAQRALTKLGLGPLKADGLMGQGTRSAIERFERDAKLTVTGALGPRTARALAAKAGMPVE